MPSKNINSLENHTHYLTQAIQTVLSQDLDDPKSLKDVQYILREIFRQPDRENIPYPLINAGKKLIQILLKEAVADTEYRQLFEQFSNEPYLLTKILIQKDPERFFDFFLVAWNIHGMLSEFITADEDRLKDETEEVSSPSSSGDSSGSRETESEEDQTDSMYMGKIKSVLQALKENIRFMDEKDIFVLTIPFFKLHSADGKDGFERGNEIFQLLLKEITEEESNQKLQKVYARFIDLIQMEFGEFKPHLKRKNFPYITVRNAIYEMANRSEDQNRRFAHFDTRTGKTSLALLEPEYLGKKHVIYICPPDTIPTVLREHKLYGGDEKTIKEVRNEDDIKCLLANPNIKYCIFPSSLLTGAGEVDENVEDEYDEMELLSDMKQDSTDLKTEKPQQSGGMDPLARLRSFKTSVSPLILEIFDQWKPDYVAVDEARHFTGYHCELGLKTSKRSEALLHLLNRPETLEANPVIRFLDATPGDLPRHFYPLLSLLYPGKYPTPHEVRDEVGPHPYTLMSLFSKRTDQATQSQVYNPPSLRLKDNVPVDMMDAQRLIYEYASKYSTKNALYRLTLARLATSNPVLLRPIFADLVKPYSQKKFREHFDSLYKTCKQSGLDSPDWDFLANNTSFDFFIQLFSLTPSEAHKYFHESEIHELAFIDSLNTNLSFISSKSFHVINRLRSIQEGIKMGERHPDRIIIYSNFKRGVTRNFSKGNEDDDMLEAYHLAEMIRDNVPGVNVLTLDGGDSSRVGTNGFSPRDEIRKEWAESDGINVLIAVGPATCQGVDLTSPGHSILEMHMDSSLDSRADYQIKSRTLGPRQNRRVERELLMATAQGENTIDHGVRSLLEAKEVFRDLVCREAVAVAPDLLKAIESRATFLGAYCTEKEQTSESIVQTGRKKAKKTLKNEK